MNLLLLEPEEVDADGQAVLRGRRARHLREVLGAGPERQLRVGLVDGPLGTARIVETGDEALRVRCLFEDDAPPRSDDTLVLAVPRPRVLQRLLEHSAALGFGRIVLLRSWRVDKSHLRSHALRPDRLRARLLAGLEQARRTRVPEVSLFPLFKPCVEDVLDGLVPAGPRFVAHPAAERRVAELHFGGPTPFTLALGPEGGWIPYEVDMLAERGFQPVSIGPHPLRTESALSVLHGQLDLLRERATREVEA